MTAGHAGGALGVKPMLKKLLLIVTVVFAAGVVLDAAGLVSLRGNTVTWESLEQSGGWTFALPIPRSRSPMGPMAWMMALLAPVVFTLPRRGRPGWGQLLGEPAFALPSMAASAGFFMLDLIPASGFLRAILHALALPLPDWDLVLFPRAGFPANPLFYSAVIPLLLSPLGVRFKAMRWPVAGIACGFAGTLACAAWTRSPPVVWLGNGWLAMGWLAASALGCLFLARGLLMRDTH